MDLKLGNLLFYSKNIRENWKKNNICITILLIRKEFFIGQIKKLKSRHQIDFIWKSEKLD